MAAVHKRFDDSDGDLSNGYGSEDATAKPVGVCGEADRCPADQQSYTAAQRPNKVFRPVTESSRDKQLPPARHWTPELKLKLRREERQLKKDRERTLQYFLSMESALKQTAARQAALAASGAVGEDGDAGEADGGATTADVLDGFVTELARRARTDSTLFHNRTVCRVVELALSAAQLRHVEAVYFALLGQFGDLMASPTASFVCETLFAAAYRAQGARQRREAAVAEGTGAAEPESARPAGMPPLEELVALVAAEAVEGLPALLWHKAGAKAVAGLLLILSGFPVRGVPAEDDVSFPEPAATVAAAVVRHLCGGNAAAGEDGEEPTPVVPQDALAALDEAAAAIVGGARGAAAEADASDAAHAPAWLAASLHPSACFVVQALVRSGAAAPAAREAVAVHVQPLLSRLAGHGAIGSRLVECYAAAGGAEAWAMVFEHAAGAVAAHTDLAERRARAEAFGGAGGGAADKAPAVPTYAVGALVDGVAGDEERAAALWEKIFAPVLADVWLDPPPALPAHLQHATQPGATAPGQPHSQALAVFIKFVAALAPAPEDGDAPRSGASASATAQPATAASGSKGRVAASLALRSLVVAAVHEACKKVAPKGAAQALCVDQSAGPQGTELCGALLLLGRVAASHVMNSFEKVRVADLRTLGASATGSLALQRLIDCAAAAAAAAPAPKKPIPVEDNEKPKAPPANALQRLVKRLEPSLVAMAQDRYGSFVVQHLYQRGSIDVRELVAGRLAAEFNELRNHFVASKVLVRCFVEQFLYRPEEWRALAARQANMRRMMAAILAAEERAERGEAPLPLPVAPVKTTGGAEAGESKADEKIRRQEKGRAAAERRVRMRNDKRARGADTAAAEAGEVVPGGSAETPARRAPAPRGGSGGAAGAAVDAVSAASRIRTGGAEAIPPARGRGRGRGYGRGRGDARGGRGAGRGDARGGCGAVRGGAGHGRGGGGAVHAAKKVPAAE